MVQFDIILKKKSWEIPKGYSNEVNQRRMDNTMTKGKRTNNDLPNTALRQKHELTRIPH